MKSPLKYNFNNQAMLIFAAMMLMSFFMGISAVMAKITITMKKTSTSSLTTWKQDIQVQNILAVISYQLLNASNPTGLGVTWRNNIDTSDTGTYSNFPLSGTISMLANNPANSLKSTTPNTWTNPFVTAEDDPDFSIINTRHIATTTGTSYQLGTLSSLGLIIPQYGGYLVETIHVQSNGTTGATYFLKISAYVCDSGSTNSTCYANSNISASSMVITTTRTCPNNIGPPSTQQHVASDPGDSFYNLKCICSGSVIGNQCQ